MIKIYIHNYFMKNMFHIKTKKKKKKRRKKEEDEIAPTTEK